MSDDTKNLPPTPTPMASYKTDTGETMFFGTAGKWLVELSASGTCAPHNIRLVHIESGVVLNSSIPSAWAEERYGKEKVS